MGRKDASIVSSTRLIWVTDTPKIAGAISRRILRTPGYRKSQRGRGSRPCRARNGSWNSSCTTPAAKTPQARAITFGSNQPPATVAAAISTRFSSTGVSAGTAKRSKLFRTAPAKPVREISIR